MEPGWLSIGKDVATVIGAVLALLTLGKGVFEYTTKNTLDRFSKFQEMRKRLKDNAEFREILNLAETNNPALKDVSFAVKRDLVGFFEEIALMVYSGILRKEVAQYMFGYYAIRLYDADNFWI
jgi:hypothetical protein